MTMFSTMLLDLTNWDLVLDASGNIAVASPPYSVAQDVATSVRTFLGEVYYDGEDGIPYFESILGMLPPAALLTQLISKQALKVPGTVAANVVITSFSAGALAGQIQLGLETGETIIVNF